MVLTRRLEIIFYYFSGWWVALYVKTAIRQSIYVVYYPLEGIDVSNGIIGVRGMVFNGTFNNISVTSWRSVLLVEQIGLPAENHQPVPSHSQTLSHNIDSSLNGSNFCYDVWK
jgi:hypothetical protein